MIDARLEPRNPRGGLYSLTWRGNNENTYSTEGNGVDISDGGIGIESLTELKAGSIIHLQARDGSIEGTCEVVHCTRRGSRFLVGLEFREGARKADKPAEEKSLDGELSHYEILQISPRADLQTIHRVFRIMALRFHPDNPETGDLEQFLRMKRAYWVLSDADRRAEYDALLDKKQGSGPRPIFALKDFVTGVESETHRRLGVLCLLYHKRQTSPDYPDVSLLDLEREMGFPREYLSFTLWYLRAKDFVTVADNADYAITATGTDYVEKKALRHDIIGKLLNPSMRFQRSSAKGRPKPAIPPARKFLTA